MIFWDDELVNYAYDIGKSYEQFMATSIKDFPRSMQEGIALLSKSNLCSLIASTIAKSQSLVDSPTGISPEITSEEILQKQVAELKGVAPKFVKLLQILRDDTFGFVFANLRSVLNKVGFSLLSHIDKLLENQKPYVPSNLTFNYWDGENGAGLLAFSSADMEELLLYIQLQRSMIVRLAMDFADTIVELLSADVIYDKNYGNHGQLTKWSRIVQNVQGFMKKDPTNSLNVLERFIKRGMNDYTLDNITSKISASDIRGDSGDYFINIIKQIKKGILSRGEILLRKRNVARYNALHDYYTKHLENKYPFSNYSKSQRTAMDADLEAVKEFFKMYDEFGGSPEVILDQIYQLDGDSKKVYDFLKKVHDIRLFFGDFFSSQYETLKVNLEINFIANKREEKNTDYLVDRIFKPNNDASIEHITADKSAIWYYGEPIELNLRWATGDDQAHKPVYDPNDPDLVLDETTAKFQCVGNWAVLRFLQKYKAEAINADQASPNQVILEFKVPLNNGKIAKVYAGVTASIPKKPGDPSSVTVKIPVTPNSIPEIPKSVMSVSNDPVLTQRMTESGISAEMEDIAEDEENEEGSEEMAAEEDNLSEEVEQQPAKSSKKKVATKSKKAKTKKGSRSKKSPSQTETTVQKEVEAVLKSETAPEVPEDDTVVEINEEPIE
jgi:hypothetical protein